MMDWGRKLIFGPTLAEQHNKSKSLMRRNQRELEKQRRAIDSGVSKAMASLSKLKQRPNATQAQRQQLRAIAAPLAREVVRSRKQQNRIQTQITQLNSVGMQIDEAYGMRKIQASMKNTVPIMKAVNSLVKIPELNAGMQELSRQLVTAGIIEEMVGDMLPDEDMYEEEAAEGEIEKVISDILGLKPQTEEATFELPEAPRMPTAAEEEDEEANMLDMQSRLEALKS